MGHASPGPGMSSPARPRWREWPAILGGRFDPIHSGHVEAARGVLNHPGAREIFVMPTPQPAHKDTLAGATERFAMARAAFEGLGLPVRIDERELSRHVRTGLPTYSFDTLSELKAEMSDVSFVLGTDQFAAIPSWHRFPEVLDLCHWIVLERKGDDGGAHEFARTIAELQRTRLIRPIDPTLWQTSQGRFIGLFPTDAPAQSSTEIRAEIAKHGEPPAGRLPEPVRAYLKASGLYGTRKDTQGTK